MAVAVAMAKALIALVAFDNSWVNRDSKELLYVYIPNKIMHYQIGSKYKRCIDMLMYEE